MKNLFYGVLLLIVLTLVACSDTPKEKAVERQPAPKVAETYSYQIEERENISYKDTPRMVVRVYLETDETPTKERMIATAKQIWTDEDKSWKEFTVFMIFGEIENFNSGAYGIAEFTPSGLKEFRVNETPIKMLEMRKAEL